VTAAPVLTVPCSYCHRQPSVQDVRFLSTGQRMCPRCQEWHAEALRVLAGESRGAAECQECGVPFLAHADERSGDYRLYVVPKDGIYQMLCGTCKDAYVAKMRRLYQGTKFGSEELKIA
jgi:transcription elongation factor Elf1